MKKYMTFAILIIVVIVLLVAVAFAAYKFYFPDHRISEIKTFSEIPGFTFDYTVFKDWEVAKIKKISENEYNIILNNPTGKELFVIPSVRIVKNTLLVNKAIPSRSLLDVPFPIENQIKNKNNVFYAFGERNGVETLEFYSNDFGVLIQLFAPLEFNKKVFYNKIIETFKFN